MGSLMIHLPRNPRIPRASLAWATSSFDSLIVQFIPFYFCESFKWASVFLCFVVFLISFFLLEKASRGPLYLFDLLFVLRCCFVFVAKSLRACAFLDLKPLKVSEFCFLCSFFEF